MTTRQKKQDTEITVVEEVTAINPSEQVEKFYKNIDWHSIRTACHKGVNNTGLVISTVGTVLSDFGTFLKEL